MECGGGAEGGRDNGLAHVGGGAQRFSPFDFEERGHVKSSRPWGPISGKQAGGPTVWGANDAGGGGGVELPGG